MYLAISQFLITFAKSIIENTNLEIHFEGAIHSLIIGLCHPLVFKLGPVCKDMVKNQAT